MIKIGRVSLSLISLEVNLKTPLDIYLQRHSPLLPEPWLHYSRRLSARYTYAGHGVIEGIESNCQ